MPRFMNISRLNSQAYLILLQARLRSPIDCMIDTFLILSKVIQSLVQLNKCTDRRKFIKPVLEVLILNPCAKVHYNLLLYCCPILLSKISIRLNQHTHTRNTIINERKIKIIIPSDCIRDRAQE